MAGGLKRKGMDENLPRDGMERHFAISTFDVIISSNDLEKKWRDRSECMGGHRSDKCLRDLSYSVFSINDTWESTIISVH